MTAGCGRRREPKVPKSLQGCGPRTDSPVCLGGWGTDGAHASCSIGKALLGTFGESQFHVWEGVCDVFRAWHFLSYVCRSTPPPHPHLFPAFHLSVLLPSLFHRTRTSSMCHTSNNSLSSLPKPFLRIEISSKPMTFKLSQIFLI